MFCQLFPKPGICRHGGRRERAGQGAAGTPPDKDLRAAKPRLYAKDAPGRAPPGQQPPKRELAARHMVWSWSSRLPPGAWRPGLRHTVRSRFVRQRPSRRCIPRTSCPEGTWPGALAPPGNMQSTSFAGCGSPPCTISVMAAFNSPMEPEQLPAKARPGSLHIISRGFNRGAYLKGCACQPSVRAVLAVGHRL